MVLHVAVKAKDRLTELNASPARLFGSDFHSSITVGAEQTLGRHNERHSDGIFSLNATNGGCWSEEALKRRLALRKYVNEKQREQATT